MVLDGQQYDLSPLWLRLHDPKQFTSNGQRLFEISDVATNPACTTVISSSSGDGTLRVRFADGQDSEFPSEWLKRHVKDNRAVHGRNRHLWGSGFQSVLPRLTFNGFCSEAGKLQLCTYLDRYGLCVLSGVPTEDRAVETLIGNEIGFVRKTNYGSIFDVIDLGTEGNSLAQTNCRILAHTDNPYRDPFPGVQLLHCLNNADEGGATTFCDGFAAAKALQRDNQEAFDMLTNVPCLFEYSDPTQGVLLSAEVPVIQLGHDGLSVHRVAFNNRSARSPPSLCGDEMGLKAYFQAWATFDRIVNSEDYTVRVRLKPGDCAVFSNSRILHGRDEYTGGNGRHIQGCYVDYDALQSRVSWAQLTEQGSPAGLDYDIHAEATHETMEALQSQEEFSYGEGIDMLQHALQAAQLASENGEAVDAVLAALMHDIGNSPQARAAWVSAGNPDPPLLVSPADASIG